MVRILAKSVLLVLLSAATAEITLRILGFSPDQIISKNIRIEPGERFFFVDSITGFNTRPGFYRVTLDSDSSFRATHDSYNARTTSTHPRASWPEIWVFGCSYTYGWSLDDSLTFCWRLQDSMPRYKVRNFGKPGFSTLQCLLFFRQLLRADTPAVVILAHASFHNDRNLASKLWMRTLAEHSKLGPLSHPVLQRDSAVWAIERVSLNTETTWWRSHSALVSWIGRRLEEPSRTTKSNALNFLLSEWKKTCDHFDIRLLVAGITKDQQTRDALSFAENIHIATTNISVDLELPGNLNLPADNHPSASAHDQYARKLLNALRHLPTYDRFKY